MKNKAAPDYPILIVDDEATIRNGLTEPLSAMGYDVSAVDSAEAAEKALKDRKYPILITDLRLPGISGMDLMTRVLEKNPCTAVLVMTAYGTVQTAVEAMKRGAFDYVTKDERFSVDTILVYINKMIEKLDLMLENEKLKNELRGRYSFGNIIGKSPKMKDIFDLVEKVSSSTATVIVYGESGTGKELIASAIHYNGNRASKPYVKLNCAALPETLLESELFGYEKGAFTGANTMRAGKFEAADGGTIFLDEIGDILPEIQVKLLRVLQEREFMRVGGVNPIKVDVRIICATNRDLKKKVAEGKFREDLYYRMNVIPIYLPPLRERREDIPLLINHFINKFNVENSKNFSGMAGDVLGMFIDYSWPGNVRQLENTIERIIVLNSGDNINSKMIPADLAIEFGSGAKLVREDPEPSYQKNPPAGSDRETSGGDSVSRQQQAADSISAPIFTPLSEIEKLHIIRVLDKLDWNLSKTARILQIDRKTLYMKIEKYGLKKAE